MLGHTTGALRDLHDLVMLDLDGVVYVGSEAVPGAVSHLADAREAGVRLAFVTNNASRSPGVVAEHLRDLGVDADAADVVTSAQAAARVLVERLGVGARVALLGAAGLREALAERGLEVVGVEDGEAAALVTGYGPDVPWRDVMRAAVRVRDGLWWVASNTDLSIPTPYGTAPGHGVLVETLRRFADVEPVVAGKPARPLLDETVRRVGGERPLMVGDRLDTDILGGRNADVPTLLVLTGVTGLADLVAAPVEQRPTYLASDLGGLTATHPEVRRSPSGSPPSGWTARGWCAAVEDGEIVVDRAGDGDDQLVDDWWRVVACAAWSHLDEQGRPAGTTGLEPPRG